MLIAYVPVERNNDIKMELCIIPDKTDQYSLKVPMRNLCVTDAAICRLGPLESLTVREMGEGIMLRPLPPAAIYLTPNLSDRPGFQVKEVKVVLKENKYSISYVLPHDQEGRWQEWIPNEKQL